MKKIKTFNILLIGAFLATVMLFRPVQADDGKIKVVGTIVKIEMASADAKEAVAILKVKGKKVPIVIQDELTMKKFQSKKIQAGDEIRCLYKVIDGKNISTSFLRTAGC